MDQRYNATTKYLKDIEDNESVFGKVEAQLKAGQSIDAGHRHPDRLDGGQVGGAGLRGDARQSLLPNVEANQTSALRGRSIDPKDDHLVPWQSGPVTGIASTPADRP